jgi:hypothetical protein
VSLYCEPIFGGRSFGRAPGHATDSKDGRKTFFEGASESFVDSFEEGRNLNTGGL